MSKRKSKLHQGKTEFKFLRFNPNVPPKKKRKRKRKKGNTTGKKRTNHLKAAIEAYGIGDYRRSLACLEASSSKHFLLSAYMGLCHLCLSESVGRSQGAYRLLAKNNLEKAVSIFCKRPAIKEADKKRLLDLLAEARTLVGSEEIGIDIDELSRRIRAYRGMENPDATLSDR